MMMRRLLLAVALLLPGVLLVRCGGENTADQGGTAGSSGSSGHPDASVDTGGSGGSTGSGGSVGTGGGAGGGGMCKLIGDACVSDAECCTLTCDPLMKVCS